jgi:proto-oncogene C-crk
MADFDPQDKNSWYFGMVSREETNSILQSERDNGVFLVRDSTSIKGDFVVCVKEDNKVSHYIVNKIQSGGAVRFRIGDQEFPNLPALLKFYKTHYLDTTPLIRPAQRQKYRAKYKFTGRDPDDLPFEKGEILTIIRKDEDQWWTACNERGQNGLVPVPYIERCIDDPRLNAPSSPEPVGDLEKYTVPPPHQLLPGPDLINGGQRKLPALARVIRNRDPNAYDKSALKLKVGDEVMVTSMNLSGQWEGEVNGQKGFFPFTHVKFLDANDEPEDDS